MRYPTLAASPHPPYDIASFTPPGVSLVNNMMIARFHSGPSALTYYWFYNQVRLHGPWDYKFHCGKKYENFGNFHYGAVGHAAQISEPVLLRAAGWAQRSAGNSKLEYGFWYGSSPFGDDPNDQYWIRAGIEYAKRAGF
ncbi:polymorphic toxin type 44 domain-containing protein [Erwinia sp. MMLR14_017]|uniref:polymorphic toxin type 44 domain-containing protein n=1 Tax=Erwinia sp. MMLR14_017 TaxID=3093842 RepID=UPI00298F9554|nr:polymorphic toxin type 44 domain-containing protein [Erwinia sp. MMLR14_017]MDW8845460.1 polymorphic toxin type 44 domain-containing protein [Erwinia sp. MMLR14_017]